MVISRERIYSLRARAAAGGSAAKTGAASSEKIPGITRDVALAAGDRIMSAADLGKVIRARRKELGYTQVEVAEMMECSPRLVGEIERGRGSVGFDRMVSYAMNLGIDLVAFKR